jgi:predicted DNA-binding transcriptional regulator AlpA
MTAKKIYLPAAAVRERYGIAKMTIWRWLQNEALGFPRPSRINNRLYWNRRAPSR